MSLELFFPPLNGGIEQGLNNAGIETFEGEIQRHIVRECTQNALDARANGSKQVRVEISMRQIAASQIPGLPALRAAIQSSRSYWQGNEKTDLFCRKALEWTAGNDISVLEVSDHGTTGLEGSDGDRTKSWFGLVQSGGVSIKANDAAGAFGIGKDAPFAGSLIRTVLYSSLNDTGEHAFQGVAKLTTHLSPAGSKTQDTGLIGLVNKAGLECGSVRIPTLIPDCFRRREKGTSLFVIAYRHFGGDDWMDGYVREAVVNFWPAIHKNSLVFQIGPHRVDSNTLPTLMNRYSGDAEFGSRFHYRAVANHNRIERRISLPHLGECHLHLVAGDATYPKTICMTRQTGMVIYEASRFRSYRPFAGLFICESTEGNTFLRQLEPPRHDKWDATRGDDETDGKNALQSIRNWINHCLRELNPDDDAHEADVPELNRYLPDDEDEAFSEEADRIAQHDGYDGIVTAPITEHLIIQEVTPQPPIGKNSRASEFPIDGQEDGEGVGDSTINPKSNETEIPGGRSDKSGSGATGQNTPQRVKTFLQTRSVRSGPNEYDLIVRSSVSCKGQLVLVSVGEDNKEDKDLRMISALDLNSKSFVELDRFSLDAEQSTRLRVTIDSTIPLSLRAYCHGN